MPWSETKAADQRKAFLEDWLGRTESVAALCARYGVSRQTGHKWIRRFRTDGERGLADRPRARLTQARATPADVREILMRERGVHPTWGPRKLIERLRRDRPAVRLPAASTVGDLLSRAGLVKPRRRSRAPYRAASTQTPANEPNAVWCIDVKGWFRTGDRDRCNPLTITDQHSRFLIACQHLDRVNHDSVQKVLERCFRELGLPVVMRSDNGPPFGARSLGGLSRLSLWLIHLGIRPEHIKPGKPQQNGAHERMHRTLGAETARPPADSLPLQQRAFNRFRREYNLVRPHQALGGDSPADHYTASPRPFPSRLPEIEYPADFVLRRVRTNGEIKWRGRLMFLGETFVNEVVGIKPVTDRYSIIYFGPHAIGLIDDYTHRIDSRLDKIELAST